MARLFPKDNSDFEVTISTHTILRVILLVVLSYVLIEAIRHSLHTLTLIGVSVFLSLALNSPVHWLAAKLPGKRRGNRTLATIISVVTILLLLGGFIYAVAPPLTRQTATFIQGVPQLVCDTQNGNGPIGQFVAQHNLQSQVQNISDQLSNRVGSIGGSAVTTATRIGGTLFSAFTVGVLTVMMLTEGPRWRRIFEQLLPENQKSHVLKVARDMNQVVQGYVNGQVLLAAIAALLISPMLFILNISYPVALVVIVFICGLIPMVGHTIGAIIVTTVALFHSIPAAIIILAYYILYQQIENYVVQPRIQANSTNISPLLVLIAVLLGANFGGLLGALVAIPAMGCLRIVVLDFLEQRRILVASSSTPNAKS